MNRKSILFLLFIIPITFFGQGSADYNLDIKKISVEDGLLSDDILYLFEDKDGLIWIGTNKGLQRYNGYDFTSWTKSNTGQIIDQVNKIYQDDSDWLWIVDFGHFAFLNPLTDELIPFNEKFKTFPDIEGIENEEQLMSQLVHGREVVVNDLGKLHFTLQDGGVLTYETTAGFVFHEVPGSEGMRILHVEKDGSLWLGHSEIKKSKSILRLNSNFEVTQQYPIPERCWVSKLEEHRGDFYIEYRVKLETGPIFRTSRIDEDGSWSEISLDNTDCEFFSVIEGKTWSRNKNKIIISDLQTGEIGIEQAMEKTSHNGISALVDSRGAVWFYNSQGLVLTHLRPNNFEKILTFDSDIGKTFNNAARGITEMDSSLLVNFEHSYSVAVNKNSPNSFSKILDENLSGNYPRPFYNQKNGNILMGTTKYISVFDDDLNLIDKYFYPNKTDVIGIWSMCEDSHDQLWIGTNSYGSLYKLNAKKEIEIWTPKEDQISFEKLTIIQNIFPCDENNLWLCASTGLYKFNVKEEEIVEHYSLDGEGNYYLPADNFYFLYEDSLNVKWIGSENGLIKWNSSDQNNEAKSSFELFDRTKGLSNNVIYAIYEDVHDRLWMSSDVGIMCFDKETSTVESYGLDDGVAQQEFNRLSHFQSEDGTIYFGGLNGLTSFHPDDFIHKVAKDYDLQILELDVFDGGEGKLVSKLANVRETNEFTFNSSDRFFRLKFTYPFYEKDKNTLFGWKVEGLDSEWNFQEEGALQFGSLPFGKNVLRIKALDANGSWSKKQLVITVNVIKPFYLRTWNIVLFVILLISLIYAFFKQRTRVLKKEITKATAQISLDKEIIENQANELKQLDELKSRFFANVSHELRTPLSLMIGPIKTLLKKNQDHEDIKLLEFVKRNSIHLNGLVNEILDLSKLENNKMELSDEPVLFYDYLKNYVKQFYSIGSSDSILFNYQAHSEEKLHIYIDKSKFEKVVNNFLSNALKFTPKDGEIIMDVSESDGSIQIMIQDSGRGISSEDLPLVFDRFFQSKNANAPAEGGTGIGLSMCKELAQIMKGEVWAESALGEGSKFYFKFPKKYVEQEVIENLNSIKIEDDLNDQIETDLTDLSSSSGATILVVEDNEDLREYYEIILSDYKIITAGHGREALDILIELKKLPDLIISDLMMPVMDGLQLIKELKSNDSWRTLPVIMLTAKTNKLEKIKALRFGIDDYITKPFDEDELKVRISNLLRHHQGRIEFGKTESLTKKVDFISQEDSEWLEKFETYVLENLSSHDLSVISLSEEFGMSERTLLRQLNRLTGMSTVKYLQEHKLNSARIFLESGEYKTVAEVAYKIGFKDPKSFTRSFKQRFGSAPSGHIPK